MQIDSFCPVGIGGTRQLDTTNLKIFVGNLPIEFRSKDLFSSFIMYGEIREAVVIPDRFRIRSRCYGFVTFVDEESVEKVFNSMPIEHENRRFTIILACKNAKPRRAHFNVRHGTSGHRPLPPILNQQIADKSTRREYVNNENESSIENRNINTNNHPKIYNDPSLFRTANIQPITPACIENINDNLKKPTTKDVKQEFPNEDIEKDFERSLRISEKKEINKSENSNQILDCIQIKKESRKFSSQSKDTPKYNMTIGNQKTPSSLSTSSSSSTRWQFALDNNNNNNTNNMNNNLDKKNKTSIYNENNNTNIQNKKSLNENITWNRNIFNGDNNSNKQQQYSTPTNAVCFPLMSQGNNNDNLNVVYSSKPNSVAKSSIYQNVYSPYYQSPSSNCNSNANIHISQNNMSQSMLSELSQIKMISSNPIGSCSAINHVGDSVSTILSFRS